MTNWVYKGKEVKSLNDLEDKTHTFVYIITNITKNKFYIGKKQVISVNRKPITKKDRLLPEFADKRKKIKTVISEKKDWIKYNGSNEVLLSDIDNGDKIVKEILHCCKTKNQATYFESKYQFCGQVLENDQDYSYNDNILGKFYRKSLDDDNTSVKL